MNGSNVWGSLAPYGDASPCSNGIFTKQGVFSFQTRSIFLSNKEYFPFKTVIIDHSLQITLVEFFFINAKCHLESFWISLPTGTAIILSFTKLLIFRFT